LKFAGGATKIGNMTAAKLIEEINGLPPEEQAKVIEHTLELARHRQLSAEQLGEPSPVEPFCGRDALPCTRDANCAIASRVSSARSFWSSRETERGTGRSDMLVAGMKFR
jgi:hypothetical protein